jgi:cytochrome c peroxidase
MLAFLLVGSIVLRAIADVIPSTVGPSKVPTTQAARLPARPLLGEQDYELEARQLRVQYAAAPDKWPRPNIDPGVEFHELGALPPVAIPAKNPLSKEKVTLGRDLFFDPRLSGSGEIACASCHDPDLAWGDGRTVAFGHGRTKLRRNAPSILFSAYQKYLFWDGRSGSLEDQAQMPVMAHDEMDGASGLKRLNEIPDYRKMFLQAFGSEEITLANVGKAIATFERSLTATTGRSAFDRFLAGKTNALSDSAIRGLHLFRTDARCINCHNGPAFTDNQFHNLGLTYYGRKFEDTGRFNVTFDPADVGKFRTPTLRNIGRTRPYMHNGLFELEGVIAAYNNGMPDIKPTPAQKDDPMFPVKDPLVKPLGLNAQDRADLLEFLISLNEPPHRMEPPELPGMPAPVTRPAHIKNN